jgi:hypothetical protein
VGRSLKENSEEEKKLGESRKEKGRRWKLKMNLMIYLSPAWAVAGPVKLAIQLPSWVIIDLNFTIWFFFNVLKIFFKKIKLFFYYKLLFFWYF